MIFCKKPHGTYKHLCTREIGHKGRCSRTSYANSIIADKTIADKIIRDAYMTPGNKKAAKNRADRCFPNQASLQEILDMNKEGLKSVCIPKKFASTPEDCFEIHVSMADDASKIEGGKIKLGAVVSDSKLFCEVCGDEIYLKDFYSDSDDADHANIGHINPGSKDETGHKAGNVKFVHRQCNIIQGDQTFSEMVNKLQKILNYQNR